MRSLHTYSLLYHHQQPRHPVCCVVSFFTSSCFSSSSSISSSFTKRSESDNPFQQKIILSHSSVHPHRSVGSSSVWIALRVHGSDPNFLCLCGCFAHKNVTPSSVLKCYAIAYTVTLPPLFLANTTRVDLKCAVAW